MNQDPHVKENKNCCPSHLSVKDVNELTDLVGQYFDIFQLGDYPGFYTGVGHEIHTGDHPPIRSRPHRTSPHIQAEIRKQVSNMLTDNIIRESTSSWSFPVCIVPKAGKKRVSICN